MTAITSQRIFSEVHKKKFHHLFNVLDADKSGYLSPEDFTLVGQKIVNKSTLDPDSRKAKVILLKAHRLFVQFLTDMENPELTISLWEWIEFFKKQVESGTQNLIGHYVTRTSRHIFDLFDVDENDVINHEEYTNMLSVYNISQDLAMTSFEELDTNHDGLISKDEMISALENFFLSDDLKAEGNLIFGYWN